MSDENKTSGGEKKDVDGFFDSLIEDFTAEQSGDPSESSTPTKENDPPRTMRDFSKFFNDAAASGSGFESTIDNTADTESEPAGVEAPEAEEISDMADVSEAKTVSFSPVTDKPEPESNADGKAKITEPVTDENGMIVIFDEEAGIDATASTAVSDEASPEKDSNITENKVESDEINISADGGDQLDRIVQSDEKDNDNDENSIIIEDNFSPDSNISDEDSPQEEKPEESAPSEKKHFIQGIIPWKGDSAGEVIRKIVFIASTGVFVAAAIMLISTLIQSREMVETAKEIEEKVTTTVATSILDDGEVVTILPSQEERESHAESVMNDFVNISDNVKGFLEIPACDIYAPVVQGDDNIYYLTHTYDDRKNKAGSIFIDYRCTVSEDYTSPNVVLYGHNQEDGTMFGNLKLYKNNVEFYRENPIFSFNTDYEVGDYVIYGYFVTNVYEKQDSNGEVFHYHDYIETLNDEATFNWYMGEIGKRNQIISPVDVAFGDKLMLLSTCSTEYSDSRFVVLARKLREGETADSFDFSTARLNPNAKQIDWDAILSRNSTSEETTTETTTSETAITTSIITAPPEMTTTVTTEPTTVTTTVKTKQSDAVVSKLSLAPKIENGTTASVYSEPESETEVPDSDVSDGEETTVPESETEQSSSRNTAPSLATQVTTTRKSKK